MFTQRMLHARLMLTSKECQVDLAQKPLLHIGCTCRASVQGVEGTVAELALNNVKTCSYYYSTIRACFKHMHLA